MRHFICNECITESYLENLILIKGEELECSFCELKAKTICLKELAEHIHTVFEKFYDLTPDQPDSYELAMKRDRESEYEWERQGEFVEDIICSLIQVDSEVAVEIKNILASKYYDFELAKMGEESPYEDTAMYESKHLDGELFRLKWTKFENKLKDSSRFFGHFDFLNELFKDLNQFSKENQEDLIIEVGPSKSIKSICRARIIHPDEKMATALANPEIELGPPPLKFRRAGRMNAHGIAVFYGALAKETAIAELRPPVGAQVLIGNFNILKPLRLLSINSLKSIPITGSVFDPKYYEKLELFNFFNQLSDHLSRPVMPDDEPLDYLVTQVISDFLATNDELNIDGILYPSTYTGGEGKNIVLFSESAIVERNNNKTTYGPMVSDEDFGEFVIFEEVSDSKSDMYYDVESGFYKKYPPPTLRLDRNSLVIHSVLKIEIISTEKKISRFYLNNKKK